MKQVCKNLFFIFFVLFIVQVHAQTQDSYDYKSEFIWGINKNSSGGTIGGFVLKQSKRISKRVFETYGLEIMNVKNPHEVRMPSAYSGNYFIYGKTHYLYALRFQYGRDIILFTKAPQQGAEVKAVFAAGPSVGIVAPYFVQLSNSNYSNNTYTAPYNGQDYNAIVGTGGILEGIGQSSIQMGGNIKAALNFELGTTKTQVTGFEAGFLLDAYFKKVPLMIAPTENYAVYPTVFLTLFYGGRK